MAQQPDGDRSRPRRRPMGGGRGFPRRRMNPLAADGVQHVDYKDVPRLRRFLSDMGKIEPRRKSGVSAKHQRSLALAIKRARHLALLPYVDTNRDTRGGGRRGGRPGGGGRGFSRGGGFGDRERGDRGDRGERGDQPERSTAPADEIGDA